ncbi:TPA: hypothetical protein EYG96_02120 [Candidatus Gracilibacteria bacterium]|nr:hypothetical protein [Candidatus Peregrinibacteria bacterium]HIQ56817.1 hypothetical protein [Candidatus Gracilibacteria bacterium]HIQ57758.1 hypothetical protein [Candidatus Gracilibacteria bacterium]
MKKINTILTGSLIISSCVFFGIYGAEKVSAITPDIPHTLIYEGRLLSKTSQKLEGAYVMRFSLWKTTDITDGEIDATTGLLDVSDADFGNWTEEIAVRFTNEGYFSAILGEQQVFTDILLVNHKYLQVEIRKGVVGDGNEKDYQVLDVDVLDDAKDRKLISSLPYAFNADQANEAITAENSAGSIGNIFVIDPDNSVENADTGEIKLQFGQMLAKIIAYNFDRKLFLINDSVEITGTLSLKSETGRIKFSAENITGNNTYILPDSESSIADETVDETFVLVDTITNQELENKTIDASKNNIVNIDASSLIASAKTKTIVPLFSNAIFEANTVQNQISIFMGNETVASKIYQYYKITTDTITGDLHSGKLLITVNLAEFESFDADAGKIKFLIKTSSVNAAKNFVDITVSDTDGLIFEKVTDQVSFGDWKIVELDLSGVDISTSSILNDKNIQIELVFNVSAGEEVFISNISFEYKGK